MSWTKIVGWLVILSLVGGLLGQLMYSVPEYIDPKKDTNIGGNIGATVGIVVGIVLAYFVFFSSRSPLANLPSFKIVRA